MDFSIYSKFCTFRLILFQISIILVVVDAAKNGAWEGTLIFQEDFDGDELSSKWEKVGNCEGKGENDNNLECFTARYDNVRVKNGILTVEAVMEEYTPAVLWEMPKNYTSGRVKMTNDLGFKYGTFVVRARLAKGSHLLSSINLLPAYQDHDNCKYEEIDVVQGRGQRTASAIVGAAFGRRWNFASVRRTQKVLNVDLSKDYHEFAVVWKKYRMEWYVDKRLIYTLPMYHYSDWLLTDESNLPCNSQKALFAQELQMNFDLSVGGSMFPEAAYGDLTHEKAADWKTKKPTLEIDWVKIYQ